jgi:hypothetical protein
MKKLNLNENFVSRIWEESAYYKNLRTTDGYSVEMMDYGLKNNDSGADYKDAKAKINNFVYTGDIEVHRTLKDWKHHKHKRGGKYANVILQVVLWDSQDEVRKDIPSVRGPRQIPTVILSKFLVRSIHSIWKDIINKPSEKFQLPCYPKNLDLDYDVKSEWIKSIGLKRLKYRASRIKQRLDLPGTGHVSIRRKAVWEQALFEFILEALGFSKNKKQFLKFASRIDLSKIRSMNLNLLQMDSLFYGTSGFLKDLRFKDDYIKDVKVEWNKLQTKLNPEIMNKSEWNFFRLRPPNFPTLRLAYASGLCFEILYKDFFKRIVHCFEKSKYVFEGLSDIFSGLKVSLYWEEHYNFGKKRNIVFKTIGKERISDIIVNVILPFLFLYTKAFNKNNLENKICDYFSSTKFMGKNEITRIMEEQLRYKINTVSDEQGMIHLHNFYCVKGRCNECKIGKILFERVSDSDFLKIILY